MSSTTPKQRSVYAEVTRRIIGLFSVSLICVVSMSMGLGIWLATQPRRIGLTKESGSSTGTKWQAEAPRPINTLRHQKPAWYSDTSTGVNGQNGHVKITMAQKPSLQLHQVHSLRQMVQFLRQRVASTSTEDPYLSSKTGNKGER